MNLGGLALIWVAIFLLRAFLGNGGTVDEVALWVLRFLSVALAIQFLRVAFRLLSELISAAKDREVVFTNARVRALLLISLLIGLAFRFWGWHAGDGQGIAGWAGAALIVIALLGLALQYGQQVHRRPDSERLSFWHPYWRIGLVAAWLTSLVALTAAQPSGVAGGLLVALFWLSLIALAVQVVGGRMLRTHSTQ